MVSPVMTFQEVTRNAVSGVAGINAPNDAAITSDGRTLYVTSYFDSSVAIFSRDPATGVLTYAGRVQSGVGGITTIYQAFGVDVSADDRNVYVASPTTLSSSSSFGSVTSFARDPLTGALTLVDADTPTSGVTGFVSLTVSPDGKNVYAVGGRNDGLANFSRDASTGALTLLESFADGNVSNGLTLALGQGFSPTASPINNVQVSGDGTSLYVTSTDDNAVSVFGRDVQTGALTLRATLTDGAAGVDGLQGASSLILSPDNRFLYVSGQGENAVAVFARDLSTSQLTFVAKVTDTGSSLAGVRSLAVSPDGQYLFASALTAGSVNAFARDATTGLLTLVQTLTDGVGGVDGLAAAGGLIADPTSRDLYITGLNDSAVAHVQTTIPSLVLSGAAPSASEGGINATLDAALRLFDGDSPDLVGATVTISQAGGGIDTLSVAASGGVSSSFDPTTGTLTLVGSAPLATYEAILRTVAFRAGDDQAVPSGSTRNRTVTFQVSDGDNTSSQVVLNVPINGASNVDTTPPAAPVISSPALSNDATPVLTGAAEAGSTVTVTIAGAIYTTVASGGAWSIDLGTASPVSGAPALDPNGANAVSVIATDAVGNASAAGTQSLVIDTTPPAAPVISSATPTSDATPALAGTAEDVSTITVTVGGATYTTVASGGAWSIDLGTASPVSGAPALDPNGANAVSVIATDAVGNASAAGTQSLVIDTTPPAAPVISSPALSNDAAPVLTGAAEAGSTVTVTIAGAIYTTVASGGAWSIDLGTASPVSGAPALDPNGANAVSVIATDAVGNASAAGTQSLVIDTTPPVLGGNPPTGGAAVSGAAERGQVLEASNTLADADGLGAINYRWQRDDGARGYADIAGATGASYALAREDIGHAVRVVASYVDGFGAAEAVASDATAPVAARAIPVAEPVVGVSSTRTVTYGEVAARVADGDVLALPAGTEEVRLVDGTLSFGSGTDASFLTRLYGGLLGRGGDARGLYDWSEGLDVGLDRVSVARGFLDGPEYQGRHGAQTDAQFVATTYRELLLRDAEPAGEDFWTRQLAGGASRAEVLAAIADSAEARDAWSGTTGAGVFVADEKVGLIRATYRAAFGRDTETTGLVYHADEFEAFPLVQQFGDRVQASPEFAATWGGRSDAEYVAGLYRNALGREAEAAELAYYEAELAAGAADRSDVLLGFVYSPEGREYLNWEL